MRNLLFVLLLAYSLGAQAQNSAPSSPPPANSQVPDSPTPASKPAAPRNPNLAPPRSDRVNASDLGDEPGESSSKDSKIDLSPPEDDAKAHPQSSEVLMDMEGAPGNGDVSEVHPWNPHKAAKAIELGD